MSSPAHVSRNGILLPPEDACISVFNPALYGSYGVYESMQVTGGVVFELDTHLHRLAQSASIIELPLPANLPAIRTWIENVVAAQDSPACTIRLFIVGPDNGGEPVVFIWAQSPATYPDSYHADGVSVITFEGRRYLPQAKSLNTLVSFMAQRHARGAGVHEALLHHDGCITEGSNSNLFVVIEGEVRTPPASEVLSGVTRDIVIELARQHAIPLREEHISLAGVAEWDECFITSTSRHIMPVTQVDAHAIGRGRPGPLTRRLAPLFDAYFTAQTDSQQLSRCG